MLSRAFALRAAVIRCNNHFFPLQLDRLAKISPDGEPISFVLPKEIGERKGACPVPLDSACAEQL